MVIFFVLYLWCSVIAGQEEAGMLNMIHGCRMQHKDGRLWVLLTRSALECHLNDIKENMSMTGLGRWARHLEGFQTASMWDCIGIKICFFIDPSYPLIQPYPNLLHLQWIC